MQNYDEHEECEKEQPFMKMKCLNGDKSASKIYGIRNKYGLVWVKFFGKKVFMQILERYFPVYCGEDNLSGVVCLFFETWL